MNEMKPIHEMIHILYQWLQTMYTSVKSFAFRNVLNYTTSGFPLIRGFPSHGWNDTHHFMVIAEQVYKCEVFHCLKYES